MWNQSFDESRQGRGSDNTNDRRPRRGGRGEGHRRGGFAEGAFGQGMPFGPGGHFGGPRGFGGPGGRRGRARRGDVRQAVLALLAEEPMNGYQMIQAMAERTDGGWKPSPGAIYPALAQLEDEGLVEQFDNNGAKAYRLTDSGRTDAEKIDPKPWETFNAENAPDHPEALRALWKEFRSLAMAAQELTRSGSRSQQEQAAKILGDARRNLYGLLASDDTDEDADLANSDDLR